MGLGEGDGEAGKGDCWRKSPEAGKPIHNYSSACNGCASVALLASHTAHCVTAMLTTRRQAASALMAGADVFEDGVGTLNPLEEEWEASDPQKF